MTRTRANILGVGVDAVDMEAALARIEQWIADGKGGFVCVTSAHGIMESQSDAHLMAVHGRAGMVVPDGAPVAMMARWLGFPDTRQVYGPELMRRLSIISAQRGYRQFYYGGGDGVAEALRDKLQETMPGLDVVGTCTPPFRPMTPEEDAATVAAINAAKPDIVWVGLSTPKQELWMDAHAGRLDVPVMIGVGAAFDFLSGTKPLPPAWVRRSPLQWLWRLVSEPRRLWRRYLRIVPGFLWHGGLQLLRLHLPERRPRAGDGRGPAG